MNGEDEKGAEFLLEIHHMIRECKTYSRHNGSFDRGCFCSITGISYRSP